MSALKIDTMEEILLTETKAEVIRVPVKVHERLKEIALENNVSIFSVFRTFVRRGLKELEDNDEFRNIVLSFDNSKNKANVEMTKKRYNYTKQVYDDVLRAIKKYRIMNKNKFIIYCLTEGIKEYDNH